MEIENNKESNKFLGFSTGCGKKMEISED